MERSWLMNVSNVNVVFHRYAFMKLKNYFSTLQQYVKFEMCCQFSTFYVFVSYFRICRTKSVENILDLVTYGIHFFKKEPDDPPVPPGWLLQLHLIVLHLITLNFLCLLFKGAIKMSFSIRLNTFTLKLCNKDEDLLMIKVSGVENDCIYNANERMILRVHLTSLNIDDLNNTSFYTKVSDFSSPNIAINYFVIHLFQDLVDRR